MINSSISFDNQTNNLKIFQLQISVANNYLNQNTTDLIDLSSEVVLDTTIKVEDSYHFIEPKSIFITGTTGFVGAFLLQELLTQTKANIYCLVRSPNANFAKMRIQKNLESYGIWNQNLSSRIIPISGDLSKPKFGLSNEQFEIIASQIDVIYHSAAWLNWVVDYYTLKPINVLGTQEILRLASYIKIKPVHYLSTVAVFESSAYYGKTIKESEPLIHSKDIYLGYSQSKWVAEKIVTIARERGLPVCIYRPPLISGHSQTGVWNTDDVTCKMIKGCIELGYFPDLDSIFDQSPVDYIVQAIVYLSQKKESLGQTFNLNNPNPLHNRNVIKFISSLGYSVQSVSYDDWLLKLSEHATNNQKNLLFPLLPFFMGRWSQTQIAIPQVYEKTKKPDLDYENTRKALVNSSIECHPVNSKLLNTYFSYFIDNGFLHSPKVNDDANQYIKNITKQLVNKQQINKQQVNVVWDEPDLLEFAQGNIANVFGENYQIIDSYSRRVRLPLHPYLLVSRVTKIDAKKGEFKPSSLTTEYDIPHNAWYSVDGQIPGCIALESGQCNLLLISYLGIDFQNQGNLVYRLLDCTITFLDELPKEGETLRYDIKINSFARSGNNLLFFFSYECFIKDKMIIKMDGGCAGFFSDKQLEQGKGVIVTDKEKAQRKLIEKQKFEPLLVCNKSSFDERDILNLIQGNLADCFGDHYHQYGLNKSLRFPPQKIMMIDKITSVDSTGGDWGLGLIIAEKQLEPEHWYFPCHFKDDQVLAGSLQSEGCSQLLQFYLLYLGLHTCTKDARFQPIYEQPQIVRCRGQVTPISAKLIYRLEVKEIGLEPHPYAICNVDIILQGKTVVHFQDLGLQLVEKNPENYDLISSQDNLQKSEKIIIKKPALLTEIQIQEFCIGEISKCFGTEFKIYDQGTVKASRIPNTHLSLVSRVLEVKGERHKLTKGSAIITEYDVPINPWYYRQNSSETTPYSILMEIALQPCGFLSAYLGTTLLYPNQSLYFRNLDGEGIILKDIDIRGQTITNKSTLLSTSNIQGMILQSFNFELICNNEIFYQGTASFGHFSPNALANQVGLDQGKNFLPWYQTDNSLNLPEINMVLRSQSSRNKYYQININKPHYRLAQHQLDLLNDVKIIEKGGKYQQGYIYARKDVKLTDWYFKCHFYQDPVMPGSLGVESMLQAMQVYALHLDLGKHLQSPRFMQLLNHKIIWKYRGQIPPQHPEMYLEIHLNKIEINPNNVIIIGDGSLWKPNMRIYEVKDLAICLVNEVS